MKNTETATRWIGWHRPNKRAPWKQASEGDTEDEAFHRLLNAVKGGDKVILKAGEDPNRAGRQR
jgi:hypothetical protein